MQEICDAILGEYEVSGEQSERELLTLLGELSENGSYSGCDGYIDCWPAAGT